MALNWKKGQINALGNALARGLLIAAVMMQLGNAHTRECCF